MSAAIVDGGATQIATVVSSSGRFSSHVPAETPSPHANSTALATPEGEEEKIRESLDPAADDPKNWSRLRKYSIVILISLTSVSASVCSTAFEPALPAMMKDFHSSSDALSSLFITVYLLGYVLGPLLLAPMCELYGRTFILWPAYILFIVTLVVCATATTLTVFIVIRCFMGFAANAFVIAGPGIVADIILPSERGLALSVLSSGSILGPTLGPLIGGAIVQGAGWRWVFWTALILFGVLLVSSIFVLRETYAPIVQQRSRHSSQSASTWQIRSLFARPMAVHSDRTKNPRAVLLAALLRPLKLFFRAPIIPLLSLYTSVSYTYLNVLFATLGTVFEDRYQFQPWASGLTYLGMTVGFIFALIITGAYADRLAMAIASRSSRKTDLSRGFTIGVSAGNGHQDSSNDEEGQPAHGQAESVPDSPQESSPEARLPLAIVGSVLLVPSILMYGYTLVSPQAHWIVPLIATALISAAGVWSFMAAQMYLVDAYGIFSSSATGAVSIFRSICAALVPLAANPAYDRWGYGFGNAVFALVGVPFVLMAIWLFVSGRQVRERFVVKL